MKWLWSRASASPSSSLVPHLKSAAVLLLCLAGTIVYGVVVNRHYPIGDWLVLRIGLVWLYTILLNLACVSIGALSLRNVFGLRKRPLAESLLLSMALGLTLFCLALYVAGALSLFKSWFAIGVAIAFTLAGAKPLIDLFREAHEEQKLDTPTPAHRFVSWAAVLLAAPLILLLYLQCMTPAAINFDASWYHIPIAQDYARAGKIIPFPSDYNRAFPHLMSMIFTWGYLVPGLPVQLKWMAALHFEFAIVLWKIVGVAAAAQWLLNDERRRGLWAVFFLFPSIFVYDQNIGGSADHFMGFFALPMMLALAHLISDFDPRKAVLFGVIAGGATLTKYQAVYMLGASGVILAVWWTARLVQNFRTNRNEFQGHAKQLLLAAGVAFAAWLLVSSPHFLKNWIFYGNPIYPMGQALFSTTHPIHEKSAFFFKNAYPNHPWEPPHGVFNRVANSLKLFATFPFAPHYSFTRDVPCVGALFTLLVPVTLFLSKTKRIWFGILVSFLAVFVWSNTYIVDRYLQAILPIFAAVTAAILVRTFEMGILAKIGAALLVLFQIVWQGDSFFYSGHDRLQSAVTLIRSGFEKKRSDKERFPWRKEQLEITAATPPDAKILVRNYRTTLGIDREVLSDVQAWQNLFFYEPIKSTRELYDLYQSRGVTHILHAPSQPPFDTVQASVLFADFIERYGKKKKRYGAVELMEMPSQAPPVDGEFPVLVAGVDGYSDGEYLVQDLTYYTRLPKEMRSAPKPRKRIPNAAKELLQAAENVRAVVVGDKLKANAKSALAPTFNAATNYKGYTILLRDLTQDRKAKDAEPVAPTPEDPALNGISDEGM